MFASSLLWQLRLTSAGKFIRICGREQPALISLHTSNSVSVSLSSIVMSACPFDLGTVVVYDQNEHDYISNTPGRS